MVETHFTRLSTEDRQVLEVASVAGRTFSAAAVAAGLGTEVGEIEGWCAGLSRSSHFLQVEGIAEWPDGTVADLLQLSPRLLSGSNLRSRVPLGLVGSSFHQRIWRTGGKRFVGNGRERLAAELAVHFERGRDYRRAVQYHELAAQNAMRCHAYREARSLLTKGLELLKALPDTPSALTKNCSCKSHSAHCSGGKWIRGPRSGNYLCAGASALSAARRDSPALPRLARVVVFYLLPVELQKRARARGAALHPSSSCP